MRVKLFWKNEPMKPAAGVLGLHLTGGNATEFESEINSWLAANPRVTVVEIHQSASGGSYAHSLWLISVWYEETD
jgi:hypothetical protein